MQVVGWESGYKLKKKIGTFFFQISKIFMPTLSEKYQNFDIRMLLNNEVSPKFPWKKYVNKINPYFKKWGFKVSDLDAQYYSAVSGIKVDYYVTRSMAVHYIYPYLDRYDFVPAYMDKNVQKALLRLPDDGLNITAAEDVLINSNGVFYGADGNEMAKEDASSYMAALKIDMILKPSVETYGGHGVIKIHAGTDSAGFSELFSKYRSDFVFQKIVEQHPVMAQFNASSVNTVRVVTYRKPDRARKVLYACIRFGGVGSVMDNVCSGGGFSGIDIETGRLKDRKIYSYFKTEFPKMPESMPDQIPFWNKIVNAALALHGRLPQLDIIGWDFAISPSGEPVLIEFNPRPGVGLQVAVGPMFSKEDLDELMAHVSKVSTQYAPLGVIKFNDKPGRFTIHYKFGGN